MTQCESGYVVLGPWWSVTSVGGTKTSPIQSRLLKRQLAEPIVNRHTELPLLLVVTMLRGITFYS